MNTQLGKTLSCRTRSVVLCFIDARLETVGTIRPKDIMVQFGCSRAYAVAVLSDYRKVALDNIELDGHQQLYVRTKQYMRNFLPPLMDVKEYLYSVECLYPAQRHEDIKSAEILSNMQNLCLREGYIPTMLELEILSTVEDMVARGERVSQAVVAERIGISRHKLGANYRALFCVNQA